MAISIEHHESRIEVLVDRDVPIPACPDDHRMKAFRDRHNCIPSCESLGIPDVQAHHIRIEKHHLIVVNYIKNPQL